MARSIGVRGRELIELFESLRLKAYRDQAGIWTIGIGHIGPDARDGNTITKARAYQLFEQDVAGAVAVVNSLDDDRVDALTQLQFDALVSFEFNTGALSSRKNTVTRHVLAGRDDLVDDEMLRWNKVKDPATGKKVVSNGLKRRRHAEAELWVEGSASVMLTAKTIQANIEATAVPVAPPTAAAQASTSPAVHGSAIATVSTVLSTATEQIEPLAAYSDTLRIVFVVLALAGVGLAVWGATRPRGAAA